MGIFRIRWRVRRNGDMVALLAEGPPSDKKDYRGKRTKKGYRIKGPRSGWLDFQMEIDVLKASRDAADDTQATLPFSLHQQPHSRSRSRTNCVVIE